MIHPGSKTLRIGRATDTLPLTVPHVIARRHKQSGQARHEDAWLLREGLNVCHSSLNILKIPSFFFTVVTFLYLWSNCCMLPTWQKAESNEQRQNGLKMVDQAIWSKKMSNGMRRTPVSAEQVCILKSTLTVLQYLNKLCDKVLKTVKKLKSIDKCVENFSCLFLR